MNKPTNSHNEGMQLLVKGDDHLTKSEFIEAARCYARTAELLETAEGRTATTAAGYHFLAKALVVSQL